LIAIKVRWAMLKIRFLLDFYLVSIAHPTVIKNGAKYDLTEKFTICYYEIYP
jgi:hypothetical protein